MTRIKFNGYCLTNCSSTPIRYMHVVMHHRTRHKSAENLSFKINKITTNLFQWVRLSFFPSRSFNVVKHAVVGFFFLLLSFGQAQDNANAFKHFKLQISRENISPKWTLNDWFVKGLYCNMYQYQWFFCCCCCCIFMVYWALLWKIHHLAEFLW